jgi:hypothetical protein
MKRIGYFIIGLFLLISSSCEDETKSELKSSQKNKKKTQIVIKQNKSVNSTKDIENLLKKNKNFGQLFGSLHKNEYSIEELIDITKQNLDYIKELRQSPKNQRIDTATVSSRLVLTEINLRRLHFLLNKNNLEKDSIEKTLNIIISNINNTINQIKIYNYSFDEFEDILAIDSIQRVKHDSLQKLLQKSNKPNIKGVNFKLKKMF